MSGPPTRPTAAIVITGGLRYGLGSAQFNRLVFDASDPAEGIVPSVEGEQPATFHDLSFNLGTSVEFLSYRAFSKKALASEAKPPSLTQNGRLAAPLRAPPALLDQL